jgi:hypothetical protein
MGDSCCDHRHEPDQAEASTPRRRVLWMALIINAGMFAVEIGAGLAAGSASLQADALDFLGDAANFSVSLFVVGMGLRYRAIAALIKGASMGVLGLWGYRRHSMACVARDTAGSRDDGCGGCRCDCCKRHLIRLVVGIPRSRRQHALGLDMHPQ